MAKANKRQALGRGLSALLDDSEKSSPSKEEIIGNVVELQLGKIEINPFQPRTNFNEQSIEDLAKSIHALGVIQPITVRKIENDNYQLVSGERRLRAAKSVGLQTIPSFIRIADDQELLEMALVENIQREDLDPIEIALSYQQLIDEIELTHEELSERVGKKRSTISNYIRLLNLDPIIQTGMRDGFISMGHGRALITVEDRSKQLNIYEQILAKGLSVRATEKLLKSDASTPTKKSPASNPYVQVKLAFYKSIFGEKVRIKLNSSGGGQIIIPFSSKNEFNALTKRLQSDS